MSKNTQTYLVINTNNMNKRSNQLRNIVLNNNFGSTYLLSYTNLTQAIIYSPFLHVIFEWCFLDIKTLLSKNNKKVSVKSLSFEKLEPLSSILLSFGLHILDEHLLS